MAPGFLEIASTPSVLAAQEANGSAELYARVRDKRSFTHFTPAEADFISRRDSFYMATVSESGWPYVQHRGGPAGFLHVVNDRTLAFADYSGNRQYISLGNATANNRVALILLDYPNRRRMKIYARIDAQDLSVDDRLTQALLSPDYKARPERLFLLHLEAFDWNCPQHITPRFTETELATALAPMRDRLEFLEAENARLQAQHVKDV